MPVAMQDRAQKIALSKPHRHRGQGCWHVNPSIGST